MKTMSGWEAAHCDEHPFRTKIKGVFEPFLSYRCLNKSNKEDEKWHFCYPTLLRLAVFRVSFGHLYESY